MFGGKISRNTSEQYAKQNVVVQVEVQKNPLQAIGISIERWASWNNTS